MAMNPDPERRLRVDPVKCKGYAYCAEIVPELVGLDDWGFPIVNERPIENDDLLGLAHRAVATCPRLALIVEERQREGNPA